MISIRTLQANEGLLLKKLRLSALQESPDAFSPTYDETSIHDDDYWMKSAQRIAAAPGFEIFIASYNGEPVGLVSGQVDKESIGHIGAMWANPDIRGKGIGRRLLDRVVTFLREDGCKTIELTVTETNNRAIQLYRRTGFEFTGVDVPLREGSDLLNREMILSSVSVQAD